MNDTHDDQSAIPVLTPPTGLRNRRWLSWVVVIFIVAMIGAGLHVMRACPWLLNWLATGQMAGMPADNTKLTDDLGTLQQRVATLETQVKALSETTIRPAPVAAVQSNGATSGELDAVKNDLAVLGAKLEDVKHTADQGKSVKDEQNRMLSGLVAASLALMALDEQAAMGHGFAPELKTFRATLPANSALLATVAKLDPYADKGAPTLEALKNELMVSEPELHHNMDKAQADHWWERILVEVKSLVSVRSAHDVPMLSPVTSLETALDQDDLVRAVTTLDAMPADTQKILGGWRQSLEARHNVEAALRALSDGMIQAAATTNSSAP